MTTESTSRSRKPKRGQTREALMAAALDLAGVLMDPALPFRGLAAAALALDQSDKL